MTSSARVMRKMVRTGITYVIVGFIVLWLFQQFAAHPRCIRQ